MGKKRVYAVVKGRATGVFEQPWDEVRKYVEKFPGAIHQAFNTRGEAMTWYVETSMEAGASKSKKPAADMPSTNQQAELPYQKKFPRRDVAPRPKAEVIDITSSSPPTSPVATISRKKKDLKLPSKPSASRSRADVGRSGGAGIAYPVLPGLSSAGPYLGYDEDVKPRFFPDREEANSRQAYPSNGPSRGKRIQVYDNDRAEDYANIKHEGSGVENSAELTDSDYNSLFDEPPGPAQKNNDLVLETVEKPTIPLTAEQDKILQTVLKGENVFFTGPAGSGKSLVLAHIKYHLTQDKLVYAVTAPTGIAAVLIGGVTMHSFFGVGTGSQGVNNYLRKRGEFTEVLRKRIQEIDVLIVDEISMVNPDLWEKVDKITRWHRGNDKMHKLPFGGLQVIVCGDFYQLPPVDPDDKKACTYCAEPFPPRNERRYLNGKSFIETTPSRNDCYFPELIDDAKWLICQGKNCQSRMNDSVKYVFQTEAWQKLDFKPLVLTKVHRQSDEEWVNVLNQIKHSNITPIVETYLRKLSRPLPILPNGIRATNLYSHRKDVDTENRIGLNQLPGDEYVFKSMDNGWYIPRSLEEGAAIDRSNPIPFNMLIDVYFNSLQSSRELKLKTNAQVMLVSNLDVGNQLVNGSRGIVKGFATYTLDRLLEHATKSEKSSRHILKLWFDNKQQDGNIKIPLVSFSPLVTASSAQGAEAGPPRTAIPIFPVAWDSKMYHDESSMALLQRIQLPLALAWATTIHKSQGMTLDYTSVDIRHAFAAGQSYVALSRSRSPEGLSVLLPLTKLSLEKVIITDPIVERFTALLAGEEEIDSSGTSSRYLKSEDMSFGEFSDIKDENISEDDMDSDHDQGTFAQLSRAPKAGNSRTVKQSIKQFKKARGGTVAPKYQGYSDGANNKEAMEDGNNKLDGVMQWQPTTTRLVPGQTSRRKRSRDALKKGNGVKDAISLD